MKVDGITLLAMARDNELKPKTILKTEHEKQYFDDRDYDYYIYFGENQFHRCNEKGILGSKYQNRFLNYEVLRKEFELIEPIEEKEIENNFTYIYNCNSSEMIEANFKNIKTTLDDIVRSTKDIYSILNEHKEDINKLKDNA